MRRSAAFTIHPISPTIVLVSMALLALLAGLLPYLSDRPPESAWLIPALPLPILFTVLVGGIALHHFATRETLFVVDGRPAECR